MSAEIYPVPRDRHHAVDVIYLAACRQDTRLARICIASIRYFYPDIPIAILPGDQLPRGLVREFRRRWNVGIADIPAGSYGWGMVKLEPLFAKPGQRFMVVDADTIFTGKVLDALAGETTPFIVDDERIGTEKAHMLYFNPEKLRGLDPAAPEAKGLFNSGQWIGTSGLVGREAFDGLVEWSFPRRLRHPGLFQCGDQGAINYVFLKKEALGELAVKRHTLMRWPGHSMADLDWRSVKDGTAPALVVHWAGMKALLLRHMAGYGLLDFFEGFYFSKIPGGYWRRHIAAWRHIVRRLQYETGRRIVLRYRIWFGGPEGSSAPAKPARP